MAMFKRASYEERKDNVAQITLSARHCEEEADQRARCWRLKGGGCVVSWPAPGCDWCGCGYGQGRHRFQTAGGIGRDYGAMSGQTRRIVHMRCGMDKKRRDGGCRVSARPRGQKGEGDVVALVCALVWLTCTGLTACRPLVQGLGAHLDA